MEKNVHYAHLPARGIREEVIKFYNILTKVQDGNPITWGFIYPNEAIKSRQISEKKFQTEGPIAEAGLFGRDKFNAGSKKSVTIVEGEWDAPSVYQALNGNSACVSVQSSSSALRDCKRDFEWLNSFDKVVLAFDGDEPGQKAARQVAALFDFNKVHHVKLEKYKDANEFVEHKAEHELAEIWKNARKYTPDHIINTFAEIQESLKEAREETIGTYPHPTLQNALYGLHRGELIVFKGMEGIGKTEIFRAIEYHLLKSSTSLRIGMVHLEEDKSTTIKGISTYELGIPCNLPDAGVSETDVFNAYKKAVGDNEDRLYIYTMFGGDDPDDVLESIRFLVTKGGVDVVFLDHITMLVTGNENDDERRKLDYISTKMKKMAKELRFCLVIISHVNDDGKTRGSRNITKVANTVIHMSRDLTSTDELTRNTLVLTIEKARLTGRTGPGGRYFFDTSSYTLKELPDV